MTSDQKQEFTYRITRANSTEMIVILYDMLLCYLEEGEKNFKDQKEAEFKEAVRKARNCLNELLQSVNSAYEPAKELTKLYFFCIRRLARAQVHRDLHYFEEIRRVIAPLRDAYNRIAPQNKNGAVMDNSQVVYAGLTYGKNQLSENMADYGSNRGVLA